MPGVGRSPQAEFVIIRGSSPADSEVQFEGAPVYRLYHFGGLTSFVQPRLLDKIDLYPGNFSARFGRKMGGIIDVGVRDPEDRRPARHGRRQHRRQLVPARRPPLQELVVRRRRQAQLHRLCSSTRSSPRTRLQLTAAPVYWDYQAMLAYKPSSNDRLRVMVYGSYDDLKLILAHPSDSDPTVRGGLSSKTDFHRAQITWQHQYSPAVEHEINVSAGPFFFDLNVGPDVAAQIPGYEGFLRSEWRARVDRSAAPRGRARRHLQLVQLHLQWSPGHPGRRRSRHLRTAHRPAEPSSPRQLRDFSTGRLPRSHLAGHLAADGGSRRAGRLPGGCPSLGIRSAADGTVPAHGDHHLQGRSRACSLRRPAARRACPCWAIRISGRRGRSTTAWASSRRSDARLQLTAEAFYKLLSGVIVNSPVPGENLNNDGIGRIYGGEASAKLRPTAKSSGFLSYTLSRSERNDHGTEWRLFNWDQTHILTLAGSYRLGGSWDLSGTFRYVTGNPITPVVGSIYNANTDTYKPVYGAINSARSNAFLRLDLRVEKSWRVRAGSVAAYLDVQNATNRPTKKAVRTTTTTRRSV